MVPKRNSVFSTIQCQNVIPSLAPYGAKTGSVLALYGAKNGITFWHHMVPHGASWCQKVPKRDTQNKGHTNFYEYCDLMKKGYLSQTYPNTIFDTLFSSNVKLPRYILESQVCSVVF